MQQCFWLRCIDFPVVLHIVVGDFSYSFFVFLRSCLTATKAQSIYPAPHRLESGIGSEGGMNGE